MQEQRTLSEQEKVVADQVQASIDRVRVPLGSLITQFGQQGEHPLGVAMALAMASASVVGSLAVAANHPDRVAEATLDGVFEEARKIGLETIAMLRNAANLGLTPAILAEQMRARQQAANEATA